MAERRRIALGPAPAAEALRRGDPAVSRTWADLVSGTLDAVLLSGTAGGPTARPEPRCLLPGSFNPVHAGHRRMLAMAAATVRAGGAYELAILNPDKPPLSPDDAAERLSGFDDEEAVWLTRAPTFPEKALVFPGATFAVGVDTIVRVADPRYYGGPEGLAKAISVLGACRFLVFGRRRGERFDTLDSVSLPGSLRILCNGIQESDFRADVSSTEIRQARIGDRDPD